MPSLAPAKTVRGSVGCTVSPKIRLSLHRPLPTRRQVSPPSGLSQAPLPIVPTQIVKLPLIAFLPVAIRPLRPLGEREGPNRDSDWDGEAGARERSGVPHPPPALSAPRGGERL